jgi:hypothetical protein
MIRHATNPSLTLHYENTYLGLPIQADKGPFIHQYLDRLHQTTTRALEQYRRVFAFRFDLRFPTGIQPQQVLLRNQILDRFMESFKAKIRHNRQMALRKDKYAYDTIVRFIWAREEGHHGIPHYHFVILLNYEAYFSLGTYSSGRDNIFNRLQDAWASALALPAEAVIGLVEIPKNPYYYLNRDEHKSFAHFFYRASYLCKSATKVYGTGCHGFGASRT